MPAGQTEKAEPVVGSATTKSSQAPNGGVGSSSAPLLNATKTVGSEPYMWQPSFATTLESGSRI